MQSNYDSSEMNESLGAFLRKARESKNVSIEQVAYATRISLKMLRALEEDDHTALPAPTFVRGYLQAYAKYVRIDTQDLLLRYQHHLATAPDAKRGAIRSHYLYVRERYQEKRRLVSAIVLFAVMLSVAGAFFFLKAQRDKHKRLAHTADLIQRSEEQKPAAPVAESPLTKEAAKTPEPPKPAPKPVVEAVAPKATDTAAEKAPEPPKAAPPPPPAPATVAKAPEAKAPPAPAPVVAPAPPVAAENKTGSEKKNYQLQLKANEDVWFRYQTDEDEVKDLTLRGGKTMVLRADKVFKIFSGNLGAFKATLNGKDLAPLASSKSAKSAILPESETGNYKLPLFPQFQVKHSAKTPDAAPKSTAPDSAAPEKNDDNSPASPPKP